MNPEQIEIHTDNPGRPYRQLAAISARVGAGSAYSKAPTMEDVNFKLREQASKLGANAVIQVTYKRGISATSWKALTATGIAVLLETDDRPCPMCAELVKRAAVICRFCGADLSSNGANSGSPSDQAAPVTGESLPHRLIVDVSTDGPPSQAAPPLPQPPTPPAHPPAWHPDPKGVERLRWWDGTTWTDHTHE
jgi:hypothetical protein